MKALIIITSLQKDAMRCHCFKAMTSHCWIDRFFDSNSVRSSANQLCPCLCARKLASPLTVIKTQTRRPPEQADQKQNKRRRQQSSNGNKMRGGLHCSVRLMGVGAVCDGRDQWVVRSLVCVWRVTPQQKHLSRSTIQKKILVNIGSDRIPP